ncbi:NADH-quinone oxidoreductase subunit M [Myxococcota bacterium]|nr:NADH-quinone oxidoreductase subunit M [Myxococcota bacterium]MBU1383055.1 NADH-quinone oxidoreductase subunit M [Myxococcota bacterium]MBU1497608.1 NADH-quinone oxidoreductase subunit M [Myxococcota bacterium]
MSPLFLLLLVVMPVGFGLVSLALPKRLSWFLFFFVNILVLGVVFKLKSSTGLTWDLKFNLFSTGAVSLKLAVTHLGWFFLAISSVATILFSMFSLDFNDRKHATFAAPFWMILIGATNGIFLSQSWIAFFFAWELMSWTSLLIIGHGKTPSFKAGIYYYALSFFGTMAMMAGIWLLYHRTGSWDIATTTLRIAADFTTHRSFAMTVTALFAVGFLAKSALFPFHMWPQMAHAEAPDDFSAYLSGIMIKYGIYGLALFVIPVFAMTPKGTMKIISGVPWPMYALAWISAITSVIGTVMAIFTNDMKRLMAWSTVANVGYIGVALSTNSSLGYAAALFHTANHMIFKGSIFAALAAVKFRTGEREMHKLGGLAYVMPITFMTFLLGIIAAAGIPPLSGFNSKWMIFQALFEKKMVFVATVIFFSSTGAFLYLFRALHTVFLGQLSPRFRHVKEAPMLMSFSMIILMILMLIPGIFPGTVTGFFNNILASFGFAPIKTTLNSMTGSTASINGTVIAAVFGLAVLIVFIMFLLGARQHKVAMMDNYTCGEDPEDWKVGPERYHYGYDFYQPIKPLFAWMPLGAVEKLYETLRRSIERFGNLVSSISADGSRLGWTFVIGILIIIVTGVMK